MVGARGTMAPGAYTVPARRSTRMGWPSRVQGITAALRIGDGTVSARQFAGHLLGGPGALERGAADRHCAAAGGRLAGEPDALGDGLSQGRAGGEAAGPGDRIAAVGIG